MRIFRVDYVISKKRKNISNLVSLRLLAKFFLMLTVINFAAYGQNLFAASAKEKTNVQKCAELLSRLSTKSFQEIFEDLTQPTPIKNLAEIYNSRSPRAQKRIDQQLTRSHLRRDMSFQVKNQKTGNYDRFVAVNVNARVVPVSSSNYQELVESTEPVMKSLRQLLQNLYSGAPLTAEGLGLSGLPPSEVEVVVKVIKDSMYFEPALVAPQMKDYPFLSVAGFDGAIVDPKNPLPQFYEINLGTPSGLSNNFQLLSDLRNYDRPVYNAIYHYLPKDNTFEHLRYAIESNAARWTMKSGISVVLSPGVYNGAHPDVAMISQKSGMPLVKSSDLYEDQLGNIRLRSSIDPIEDPIVTGIYGRMEESFFFQSNKDNIPLINPNLETINMRLSQDLGLHLRKGAIYDYIYNDLGEPIDVERDAEGQPKLVEVWDKIGADPNRPEAPVGSFAKAVLNRKLYFSPLGGRVADDKRLFRIVSRYLAKSDKPVASPIKGVAPYEIDEFFADPDQFVVKEPANSGGVGIHFVRWLDEATKASLIERVRLSPGDFEIQLVSPIVTIPEAKTDKRYANVAIDFRMFVMMDANGSVSAGPQSFLLRTAPEGSLYTNTSRGGGYGIGVVLDSEYSFLNKIRNFFSFERKLSEIIPLSRRSTIASLFENSRLILESLKVDQASEEKTLSIESKQLIENVTYTLRDLMDQLDEGNLFIINELRAFLDLEDDKNLFAVQSKIQSLIKEMQRGYFFRSSKMNQWLKELVRQESGWLEVNEKQYRRNPLLMIANEFAPLIEFRLLDKPEVTYKVDGNYQKVELAEYIKVSDPIVQQMIDEVKAGGGQVRFLKKELLAAHQNAHIGWGWQPPYFWVNLNPESSSYLIPVIGIDITVGRGIAALAHELEHFRLFKKYYLEFVNQGLSHEDATKAAVEKSYLPEPTLIGEKNAVAAEMKAEVDFSDSIFNKDIGMKRAQKVYDVGFVNRITYPHFEALRAILHKQKWSGVEPDQTYLSNLVAEMVNFAREGRSRALAEIDRILGESKSQGRANFELQRLKYHWQRVSDFEILFHPFGLERIAQDDTYDELWALFGKRTEHDKLDDNEDLDGASINQ